MPVEYEQHANPLTPAERQENAEVAFGIQQAIRASLHKGREALWELAEACYLFHQNQGWLALGYDTVKAWLAEEPELSQSTYSRLIGTWGKLHVQKGIPEDRLRQLELTKAAIVIPKLMENEVTVEKALADVEVLGWQDLRDEYGVPRAPKPELADADRTAHEPDVRVVEPVEVVDPEPEAVEETVEEVVEAIVLDATSIAEQHKAALGDPEEYGMAALNDASDLPWGDLINAKRGGATYPRLHHTTVEAFLYWKDKYSI